MENKISSEKQKENPTKKNNYYYLKYNENLSSYISNELDSYRKSYNKEIFLDSIFLDEESLNLFLISFSHDLYFLTIISVTSQENKIKEIKLKIPEKIIFEYGHLKLSEDRKHLVLFNEEKNKLFIIFNFIQKININIGNEIILENYYQNERDQIVDIKYNTNNSLIDEDLIIYGICCSSKYSKDLKYLILFNNKYLGIKFQIFFEKSFSDFQIVNNLEGGCDLYIMYPLGNFKIVKNINDKNNIPKSDKDEKFQNIKIYNKIAYNINNCEKILNNNFLKFYFQSQNNTNEINKNPIKIINVLRYSSNMLDIGILINTKLFIIKKYYFDEEKIDDIEEIICDIIPINNILNKYIIKSNKNMYFLDIPPLSHLCLSSQRKNDDNDNEQIKQELLFKIREIISKINLSIIMILPIHTKNNSNIPMIIYNFFKGSILFIKRYNLNFITKIYDFFIDDSNSYQNNSNNYILYEKDINKKIQEQIIFMEKSLKILKCEIEHLKQKDINSMKKSEYTKKLLEEFYTNINILFNNNNSKNINSYINQINEWYQNLHMSFMLLGKQINDDNVINKESELKKKEFYNSLKKDDEIIEKTKNDIENKKAIISENQKKIQKLREENTKKMYENYLRAMNNNNEGKNYSNELVKRINNQVLKNIEFLKENNQKNNIYENVILEKLHNFPLTIKYMNNEQKKDITHNIDLYKQLFRVINEFRDNIKNDSHQ